MACKYENIPEDWELGLITPVYKKGNHKDCNNYRGITLLSRVTKIYEQLINNRLRPLIEPSLLESQSVFRPE
ncbi:hypothetical protein Trydic_g8656, partial [Trypoxylus dichotomus]